MIRKHLLAISIIAVACLVWLGVFYALAPKQESPREFSSLKVIRRKNISGSKAVPQPLPIDHFAVVLDRNQTTVAKIRSVDLISDDLSEAEQNDILNFIRTSPNGIGEYVVKNNLMNRLIAQKRPVPNMNASFISIASDKNQDTVVRAYAVQHLRPLYERSRDVVIKDFFYNILQEENTEVSGVAMLSLNYLMNQEEYGSDFDRVPVIQQARKIALDNSANNNNRITAIQVASAEADPELADGLRKIIADKNSHSALRISAIAGLGAIGDESDIASLKVISQSKNFESRAARAALKKISNRRGILR